MSVFLIALFATVVLLLTAIPGYLLIKYKMLTLNSIKDFSKLLMYISQPCLIVYTFSTLEFSWDKLKSIGLFALLSLIINVAMLLSVYLILRKKCENPLYRVTVIAMTFGNCSFFGIPIVEALFPDTASSLLVYATVFAAVMAALGWSFGIAIIKQDAKDISARKILFNPSMIGAIAALIIYIFRIPLIFTLNGIRFTMLSDMVTITGRLATPLSMFIMGMRLATMKFKDVFNRPIAYAAVAVKQLIMPLLAFALVYFLPMDVGMKSTFFVISATPIASSVLNFSEIAGDGQSEAATMLLLGTILSVVTLPIMALLLPLF